ncbi:MAG: PDZ domain-containing protein [Candidatus Delongbacteria bacterium]|nr:PDZ domain-containing protein [Candidatus Delongbacteria bacterium]
MHNSPLQIAAIVITLLCAGVLVQAESLPRHGSFGLQVIPLLDAKRTHCSPEQGGLLVKGILPEGSAGAAGLVTGDILLSLNEQKLIDPATLSRLERLQPTGKRFTFVICRQDEEITLEGIMLAEPREHSDNFIVEYQPVTTGSGLWQGIITRPADDERHPALLVLQNYSGSIDLSEQPESPLRLLLYHLTEEGFVTMRVERAGCGDSQDPSNGTLDFTEEWSGFRSALLELQQNEHVDPDHLFLLGIGSGGFIVPLLANEVEVQGIMVYNTPAANLFEQLLASRRRHLLAVSRDFIGVEETMRDWELCLHLLLVETQTLPAITAKHPRLARFFTGELLEGRHYSYWQQMAAVRPAFPWRQLTTPVMIVRGDRDQFTSWDDQVYLARMLNLNHPGQAVILRLQHTGTLLQTSLGEGGPMPPRSSDAFLESFTNWLDNQLARPD